MTTADLVANRRDHAFCYEQDRYEAGGAVGIVLAEADESPHRPSNILELAEALLISLPAPGVFAVQFVVLSRGARSKERGMPIRGQRNRPGSHAAPSSEKREIQLFVHLACEDEPPRKGQGE
jgi:hypothetical protein